MPQSTYIFILNQQIDTVNLYIYIKSTKNSYSNYFYNETRIHLYKYCYKNYLMTFNSFHDSGKWKFVESMATHKKYSVSSQVTVIRKHDISTLVFIVYSFSNSIAVL